MDDPGLLPELITIFRNYVLEIFHRPTDICYSAGSIARAGGFADCKDSADSAIS